ncbi:MAG: DsbA family protein [Clostridiales bacterium]|nr:DsbA family protein [Clostridiales bacterium]
MRKLEVFFDYACPYCHRGHGYLQKLIGDYPDVEIVWRPCEAHPRPERGPHSDICIQGMYYVLDHGANIWAYHDRMFKACLKDRIDFENIDALSDYVRDIVDEDGFRLSVSRGDYMKIQRQGNDYAYEQCGVWAVPSYRMNGIVLDAVAGVGVTREQVKNLLGTGK